MNDNLPENAQSLKDLHRRSLYLMGALFGQYILGMYVTLFLPFPENASQGQDWAFAWSDTIIAAHMVLGILIFLGSLIFLIRTLRYQSASWKGPAIWGFVGVLLAGIGGSRFVPTQSDGYSYLMALAFLLSIGSYVWGMLANRYKLAGASPDGIS